MTSPERDGRVPETIGPYRVESLLGRGGMGEVYSGYDERLDRPVALKRVRPSSNDPASSRARFRREARVVARLSHNAIVQVHDWVEDGDELWIVMERVDGHPLRRTLDQGPLPPDRAARIARHIAAGLAVAHEAGVVHRDLKSENVMLLAEDQVKILDFGLAKLYRVEGDLSEASISASGQILGTVRYLSPEQALGHPVDHRSDLFSLGTLLYEMLTGVSPFKGDNAVETLSRICTLKPPPVDTLAPKVGAPLAQLVDQLLQKDRARRPQETREVVTRLADIGDHPNEPERPATSQDSETLLASEPLDSETVVEDDWTNAELVVVHRRRPMLGRAFAVLAAVLVLAALALWRWQPEPPPTRLYVAVPRTVVEAAADDTQVPDLAADAVHAGLLRGLLGFRDVAAVEPASGAQGLDEPTAVARALGVDEVMGSSLSCTNSLCRVSLKRIDSSDGRLRWSHAFTVDRLNLLKLTTVTGEQLRGGYPEMALRSGVPDLQVDPADWEAFLGLERAYWARDGQQASVETVLADLEDLRRRSPRFVEAPLLAATMARMRFEETRAAGDLDRAFAAVDQARTLAPGDPRVLKVLAQVQFESGRLDEAAATLDEVERIEPGDADLLAQRAELLERRGEAAQALTMMQEAVRRQPSWRNYARLSDMVYRAGDLAAARRALEACLDRWPDNFDILSRLAQLELLSGSPERAAELYEVLVGRWPGETELANLGVAYTLLKRYDAAADRFRQALELAPESPYALYNLADAEWLRGAEDAAAELYGQVLERIAQDPDPEHLLTLRAQAEARLGRLEEAVALAHEALQQSPDNPQVRYEAAVVFVLAGEDLTALLSARRAIELGVEPRWFDFPWFEPLRERLGA